MFQTMYTCVWFHVGMEIIHWGHYNNQRVSYNAIILLLFGVWNLNPSKQYFTVEQTCYCGFPFDILYESDRVQSAHVRTWSISSNSFMMHVQLILTPRVLDTCRLSGTWGKGRHMENAFLMKQTSQATARAARSSPTELTVASSCCSTLSTSSR